MAGRIDLSYHSLVLCKMYLLESKVLYFQAYQVAEKLCPYWNRTFYKLYFVLCLDWLQVALKAKLQSCRTRKAKLNLNVVGFWRENGDVRLDSSRSSTVARRSASQSSYSKEGNVTELFYIWKVDRQVSSIFSFFNCYQGLFDYSKLKVPSSTLCSYCLCCFYAFSTSRLIFIPRVIAYNR